MSLTLTDIGSSVTEYTVVKNIVDKTQKSADILDKTQTRFKM